MGKSWKIGKKMTPRKRMTPSRNPHPLTHSLTHSLFYSLDHSFPRLFTRAFLYSLILPFIPLFSQLFVQSFVLSFIQEKSKSDLHRTLIPPLRFAVSDISLPPINFYRYLISTSAVLYKSMRSAPSLFLPINKLMN